MSTSDDNNKQRDFAYILSYIDKGQAPPSFNPSITPQILQYAAKHPNSHKEIVQFLTLYFATVLREEKVKKHSWLYTLFVQNGFVLEVMTVIRSYMVEFEDRSLFMKSLLWCFRNYDSDYPIIIYTIANVCNLTRMFASVEQRSEEHTLLMTEIINVLLNFIEKSNLKEYCCQSLGMLRHKWRNIIKQCLVPFSNRWCRDDATLNEHYHALNAFCACHIVPAAQQSWLYQQLFDSSYKKVADTCRVLRKNHMLLHYDLLNNEKRLDALKTLERLSVLLLSENNEVKVQTVMLLNKMIQSWEYQSDTIYEIYHKNFVTLVTSDTIMKNDELMKKVFKAIPFFTGVDGSNDLNFDDQMLKFIDKIFRCETYEYIISCVLYNLNNHPIKYCEKSVVRLFQLSLEAAKKDENTLEILRFIGNALKAQCIRDVCISSEQWRNDIYKFIRYMLEQNHTYSGKYSKIMSIIEKFYSYEIVEQILDPDDSLLSFMLRTLEFFNKCEKFKQSTYDKPVTCVTRMFRHYGHKLSEQELTTIKHSDVWKSSIRSIMHAYEWRLYKGNYSMLFTILLLVIEMYWLDLSENTLNIFYKLIESRFYSYLQLIYSDVSPVVHYRLQIGLCRLILATDKSVLPAEVKDALLFEIDLGELELDSEELQVFLPLYHRVKIRLL
jgi:hypothetical protein